MTPMFGHGRLRLYLLSLLDERPRHGYDVIRLLQERCLGLYAPSAGTVYPRLAKLEREGLVSRTDEGGRKVYALTDAGRGELRGRATELAALDREIRDSVCTRVSEIREALTVDLTGQLHTLPGHARLTSEQLERAREILERAAGELAEVLAPGAGGGGRNGRTCGSPRRAPR